MRYFYLLLIFVLSGCSSYPPSGKGGMAESYTPVSYYSPYEDQSPRFRQLHTEFSHQNLYLDHMVLRGLAACMPGQVYDIGLLKTRVMRQLAGNMLTDAEGDLMLYSHRLVNLEHRFEQLLGHGDCQPQTQQASPPVTDVQQTILALLNSHNQFAFDDQALTVQFLSNLKQASQLLSELPHYRLLLIGHTDEKGSSDYNLSLGKQRADTVRDNLIHAGVNGDWIQTSSAGEQLPLTDSERAAGALSNRRVQAHLYLPQPMLIKASHRVEHGHTGRVVKYWAMEKE